MYFDIVTSGVPEKFDPKRRKQGVWVMNRVRGPSSATPQNPIR